jgi:glutamate-ammonia-ligase adenylyltransferase
VAQDLMRVLGEGRLYTIDPRLRPWGEQGELVANTAALKLYWQQPKDLWERMAMLRVCHLAGDPTLGNECVSLIRSTAITTPLPANAAQEVRAMRQRLEDSVAGRDHLKRGWGGYVDHEFISHYLSFQVDPAQVPVSGAVVDTLRQLGHLGRLPAEAVKSLVNGLEQLRFIESRMRLTAGKAVSSIPQKTEERGELARRCGFLTLQEFDLALHLARESARRWFNHLVS